VTTRAVANSSEAFSAESMYYDLVVKDAEQAARTDLDASLAKMQVDLARIDEYTAQMATTRIGGLQLLPPSVPSQIASDSVTGKADSSSDPLTLHSTWTSASGYAFDWRSGSVQTGYLNSIVPAGESYVKFLADKAAASNKASTGTEFNVSKLVWKLSDGTDLVSDYTGSTAMKPLLDVMNNLSQAYQDYYTDKLAYQTTGYSKLIDLEVGLKNVNNGSSINSGKTALLTY
jgi:hypothetical protein